MNCCTECFSSKYIKEIILSADIIGSCAFCDSNDVKIFNPSELGLFFHSVLNLYIEHEDGQELSEQIFEDFADKIFSQKIIKNKKLLLQEIVKDDFNNFKHLFENPVLLSIKAHSKTDLASKPLQLTWSQLAAELRHVNRFHLQNNLDLRKLGELISRYRKPIHKGKKFFRARISDEKGYLAEKMTNPPKEMAKAGRANPAGISYLYLSDDIKTTLFETRATLYDYVTIGEFRLKEGIEVINLRGDTYDPILIGENDELEEFLMHIPFIKNLETYLSKPKRRLDDELDYLPTQYLSEFIKSLGFDAIEFKSSLYDDGYNLAVFDPMKFECLSVKVHEITDLELKHEEV